MKKIVLGLGAALVMLAAAPSFAQATYGWRHNAQRVDDVRAQAMPSMDPTSVYVGGQNLGADPDPNVRLELRRNYGLRDR